MSSNSDMVKLWNSEASSAWATSPERYDAMLEGLGTSLLAAARLAPGERVIDVGCGAGQLAVQAAQQVGATGSVLAVDVAAELLRVAAERATAAGLSNVTTVQADAQDHAFAPASADAVISRFGVMFFADPVAAFANLHAATAPGGRIAFVCWQAGPLNEWMTTPLFAVLPHVEAPPMPPPGAPGPFAFADAERLTSMLDQAGWTDVVLEDVQTTVSVGGATSAEEAVGFITADTFGQMLLGKATDEQRAAALASLRDAYLPHVADGAVRLKAAAWLCTASRPSG